MGIKWAKFDPWYMRVQRSYFHQLPSILQMSIFSYGVISRHIYVPVTSTMIEIRIEYLLQIYFK